MIKTYICDAGLIDSFPLALPPRLVLIYYSLAWPIIEPICIQLRHSLTSPMVFFRKNKITQEHEHNQIPIVKMIT